MLIRLKNFAIAFSELLSGAVEWRTQRHFSPRAERSFLKTFHEFTGIHRSDLEEMQKVHKTTRFPPDRDTFIAYTFSAAEGIALAVNDSATPWRKSDEGAPGRKGSKRITSSVTRAKRRNNMAAHVVNRNKKILRANRIANTRDLASNYDIISVFRNSSLPGSTFEKFNNLFCNKKGLILFFLARLLFFSNFFSDNFFNVTFYDNFDINIQLLSIVSFSDISKWIKELKLGSTQKWFKC